MTLRQLKTGYFILEGMNSFATSFYFYYLFFYMQRQYGFGNRENLALAALNGFIYTFMAWLAGRWGQRFGYYKALAIGFGTMCVALAIGFYATSPWMSVFGLIVWTSGICFTWPSLEAIVSEGEDPVGLQERIGVYNLVWAGTSALAYFSGGWLLQQLGLRCLFWIPFLIHVLQAGVLMRLALAVRQPLSQSLPTPLTGPIELTARPIARARLFLRMSWVANPFAYVAINTVVAVVPSLAKELQLSPAVAGFFCSTWFFARLGTFFILWRWSGWHYRMRWFFGAYFLLVSSFALILLVPNLWVLFVAQLTFGVALGLIYYSSLYYSMNVGEAKGEHGGMHEAAIGAGIFAGPAIGASALTLLPAYPNSSALAVSVALCGGLIGLIVLAVRK